MSDINKTIFRNLISLIRNAADFSYQNEVWVKGSRDRCDSFDDFICEFLPTAKEILDNKEDYLLSKFYESSLKDLFLLIENYSDEIPENCNDQEVINDPRWDRIRERSSKVLESFKDHPFLKEEKTSKE